MPQLLTQVTNTASMSVTTFENYPFNSMVAFQGKFLGAGPDGLFLLDDAASVEARDGTLTTGQMHFNSEMQKRCSDFYLAMRTKGNVTLRVTTDELPSYEYTVRNENVDLIKQRRSPIGKGAKGKYWTFELECSDDFDYDTMNIAAVVVSRRL